MKPGFLHFDLRRGCTADMINAAMASLLNDTSLINRALSILKIRAEVSFEELNGIKNAFIHLYIDEKLLTPDSDIFSSDLSFSELKDEFLKKKDILPLDLAMLTRIFSELPVDLKISKTHGLWLIAQALMLTAQVNSLDPKFISATKITWSKTNNNDQLIKIALKNVPAIEVDEDTEVDVLGIAFLKALCGRFGVMGDALILEIGVGLSKKHRRGATGPSMCEAIWCEAHLPDTITENSSKKDAKISFMLEVTAIIPLTTDINALLSALFILGADQISYHLLHQNDGKMVHKLTLYVSTNSKQEAIETIFTKGTAKEVFIKAIERHELKKRSVGIILGHGQLAESYQFLEHVYGDKVVFAEPVLEDLAAYSQKTGYSVEVARSDMLSAWKRWRAN